jgi:hypothetical protein
MTQPLASPDPLLITIVLATLAIGLPILFVLAIRFLWDRNLTLGRSKELEKLIWQLHRIASAMEHQMNLSFPAVQPGTEEARDIAYLQQIPAQPKAAPAGTPVSSAPTGAATRPGVQQAAPPAAAAPQEAHAPGLVLREPSVEVPRAGVNSMFDL